MKDETWVRKYFLFIETKSAEIRNLGLNTVEILNDFYTVLHELIGMIFGRIIIGITLVFGSVITPDFKKPKLIRFPLNLVKFVVGLPLVTVIFIVVMSVGLVGGTLGGIFGLRNLAEYTRREQLVAWIPAILLAVFLPFFINSYFLYKASLCCIFTIILLGLNFLYGQCGIISVGHAAFVLVGGFLTALLFNGSIGAPIPFIAAILIAASVAGLLGYVLGLPSLRVKDYYLMVITLAFTIAVPQVIRSHYVSKLIGGDQEGIQIHKIMPPPIFHSFGSSIWAYYFIVVSFFLFVVFAYNIQVHSQIGRTFRLIKCDDVIARAQGINVTRYKLLAFIFSAFYGAYAGGLLMMVSDYISPESYTLFDSIDYFIGLAIGGPGSVLGSFLGGIFLSFESDLTKSVAKLFYGGQSLMRVFYGIVLILMICFFPEGISGATRNLIKRIFGTRIRRGAYYMLPPPDYDIVAAKDYREIKEMKHSEIL